MKVKTNIYDYIVALLFFIVDSVYYLTQIIQKNEMIIANMEFHISFISYILVVIGFMLRKKYLIVIGLIPEIISLVLVSIDTISVMIKGLGALDNGIVLMLFIMLPINIFNCLYLILYDISIIIKNKNFLYLSAVLFIISFLIKFFMVPSYSLSALWSPLLTIIAAILTKETFVYNNSNNVTIKGDI